MNVKFTVDLLFETDLNNPNHLAMAKNLLRNANTDGETIHKITQAHLQALPAHPPDPNSDILDYTSTVGYTRNLIGFVVKHKNTHSKTLRSILKSPGFTLNSDLLVKLYNHKNATKAVKQDVLAHPNLNTYARSLIGTWERFNDRFKPSTTTTEARSYSSVAASVRNSKEKYPEQFCKVQSCLWRTSKKVDGKIQLNANPCRKHVN